MEEAETVQTRDAGRHTPRTVGCVIPVASRADLSMHKVE